MKVLVIDRFDGVEFAALQAGGCDLVYEPDVTGGALAERVRAHAARVLVVRGTTVDAATLSADSLALVVRAGAGYNSIDVAEASRRGIYVINCPGMNAAAVAELALGLMIAIDRHIPENVEDLRAGRWNKRTYSDARGLAGRTLGLLGFGHIAHEVARRAHAFDMRILVWSRRFANGQTVPDRQGVPVRIMPSPQSLAAESDVLSVHLALTPQTRRFVDATIFGRMKPGAYFINTSRAGVVDSESLALAVTTNGIKAGLDVFDDEPAEPATAFHTPLARLPNVYGTHHIGASTDQAQAAVAAEAVRIVLAFKATGLVPNAINLVAVAAR